MINVSRSTITWCLSLATLAAIGTFLGLCIYRAHEQQEAIAALAETEIEEWVFALGADGGPCTQYSVRNKVRSPIDFAPHGPDWIRKQVGEEICRKWIDSPIAVNLSGSLAGDEELQRVKCFSRLKKLNASATKVTDVGVQALHGLTALEELRIGSDRLTDAGVVQLEPLRNVRVLVLHGGQITGAGIEVLLHLPKLQELSLASEGVTDNGLDVLASMKNLEKLSLSAAKVSDKGVRGLARLPRLRSLYLTYIPDISDECLQYLKDSLSGLEVVYEPYGPPP